ncbi:Hypothetical protein CAP_6232 [Chondromyces apiculatus DSM 436]|uniref:PDZ domain-containing protein n=2 Tax=Chondromyces apiculatus TaxID=51 RepID=A0A017T1N1_9BACT|nr:Hypothetical protein CAP_6232 [Chondromyces apiculatus DSM 436]
MLSAMAVLATAVAACGGTPPAPVQATAPPAAKPTAAPAAAVVPPGHVARAALDEVLLQGPPWVLRRVAVEEVIRGGNFVGWKLNGLPPAWGEAPLKVGDVVMRVNGQALERPDDLFTVWKGLTTAKEIRIAYERDGKEAEATMPVVGEPSPEVVRAIEQGRPAATQRSARRKGVTVIEEGGASGEDEER